MGTMKWLWIMALIALALPAAVPRRIHRSKPSECVAVFSFNKDFAIIIERHYPTTIRTIISSPVSFHVLSILIYFCIKINKFCNEEKGYPIWTWIHLIWRINLSFSFLFLSWENKLGNNRSVWIRFLSLIDDGYWEDKTVFFCLSCFPAPRLYGDSVPVNMIRTDNSKVRQKIVDTHNDFRTQVKPSAANMLVMVRTAFELFSNKRSEMEQVGTAIF